MAKKKWGRILNCSSIGIKFGGGFNSFNYSLSKHSLEFMPNNYKHWAKKNVFINLFKGKKKFINTEIKDIIIKPYISFSKVLILFVLKLILEYILPTKK